MKTALNATRLAIAAFVVPYIFALNPAMLSATKDKTVIFISHRLSTTRLADRIIMLEQGRIVEQGSHSELLERDGKYAQMWRVQAGAYIEV